MAKSVNQGFEEMISKIQPLDAEHTKVARHKAAVESCLNKNFGCYTMYDTGSFGNSTAVRHYSDTDYFAACYRKNLYTTSSYTLTRFREELKHTFPLTDISVNTPAVHIPFGTYASETMEVCPAYFIDLLETPLGRKAAYAIPNYEGGWMQSSPAAHNTYVSKEDERLDNCLKPLIQLMKAWKYYDNAEILSFYLELRITKYAQNETAIVYDIDLQRIFKMLYDNKLANMQDPMGISGYVGACRTSPQKETALNKIGNDLVRAEKAVSLRDSDPDEAFRIWNVIFNGKFPTR